MERFAWPNINLRHIDPYHVLRISTDEARERRHNHKGKRGGPLRVQYDTILHDGMAEMFKDGFNDKFK